MNFRAACLSAVLLVFCSSAARAECTSAAIEGLVYCNDCRAKASIVVDKDRTCERPINPRASDGVQFVSMRISRQARRGRAGTSGYTVAYNPAKGFAGPDQFEVEVNWRRPPDAGKVFITFDVTVR